MEPSYYKDISIHSFRYHYYYRAPKAGKPTLLFLHGFPSTSEHWVHQAVYFSSQGYGVIAPDMLGYGGTSKPEDPKLYDGPELAAHCIAILDAESVESAVVIGHDWGSRVASRMANLYPERHLASIFLAVAYSAPSPDTTTEDLIAFAKNTYGRDLLSYWNFFASEDGPKIVAAHQDSFYSLVFTSDIELFKAQFPSEKALKKWLLEDRRAPIVQFAPDKERFDATFKAGGWYGPTNWYRAIVRGCIREGDKSIPKERYKINYPVLLVTALQDPISLPSLAKAWATPWCSDLTVRDIDAGHWLMLEKPEEVNATIQEYLLELNL